MVNAMVLSWQNDVIILEELHPRWQTEIGVRPLVNLLNVNKSEKSSKNKSQKVDMPDS